MAVLQKILDVLPLNEEKRRFQRVRVNLLGRYMLADRREFPCQVLDMSPGGMAIIGPVSGIAGERVVAYIDHVGRLEGTIIRVLPNGFAMSIAATPRKRDKLAAQLTWLANRQILGLPEDRRHDRIVPRNPRSTMVLPDGTAVICRIIDMSLSGAAIATRAAARGRHADHARQDAEPGRAPHRRRLRGRVHPHAAPGLSRRERHRSVNAALAFRAAFRSFRAALPRPLSALLAAGACRARLIRAPRGAASRRIGGIFAH